VEFSSSPQLSACLDCDRLLLLGWHEAAGAGGEIPGGGFLSEFLEEGSGGEG
jgi:hypothetical protein